MSDQLSEFQKRTVDAIHAHGGKAIRRPGGFWTGSDGVRLTVEPVGHSASGIVGTETIRSLERKGVLKRANDFPEAWRDSRVFTDEYRG